MDLTPRELETVDSIVGLAAFVFGTKLPEVTINAFQKKSVRTFEQKCG